MVDVQWSKVKSSGRAALFPFFLDASHMCDAANKLIATTLVALLATLGCFEHLLHDVTHRPAEQAASGVQTCCHQAHQDACSSEESPASQHDPVTCTVCRHLALSQLSDTYQQIFFTAFYTSDVVVAPLPAVTCLSVTLVPIRGPPLNELTLSC